MVRPCGVGTGRVCPMGVGPKGWTQREWDLVVVGPREINVGRRGRGLKGGRL